MGDTGKSRGERGRFLRNVGKKKPTLSKNVGKRALEKEWTGSERGEKRKVSKRTPRNSGDDTDSKQGDHL